MTSPYTRIRPLVAGNWKMHGLKAALSEAMAVRDAINLASAETSPDVMICPPATLLSALADLAKGSTLQIGGQDCHGAASGAHTGDISAEMLSDAGATAVIVGHSERRANHGELDRAVLEKARAAHQAGLTAIVCIGETAGQRLAGLTLEVVTRQLKGSLPVEAASRNTIIAYEPVWAIGTGLTPTLDDVAATHAAIRAELVTRFGIGGHEIRILYGGSVKPTNAKELLAIQNVNGALVGGASLKADDFLKIIAAYG